MSPQALTREHGIRGTFGSTDVFVAGGRADGRFETRLLNDLAGELVPGAISRVGTMNDSAGVGAAQFDNRLSQVNRVSGSAPLIVDYLNFVPGGGEFKDRLGKAQIGRASCRERV